MAPRPTALLARMLAHLRDNAVLQRMAKDVAALAIASTIAVIPAVLRAFSATTFLTPMVVVFAKPGQRMGVMLESLTNIFIGVAIGLAWSMLGLYLSSLALATHEQAAYAIKGVFLLVAILFHGVVRSSSPRLFMLVLWLVIAAFITLLGSAIRVTVESVTSVIYPLLCGAGVLVLIGVVFFPEPSSSFLGTSTVETLHDVVDILERASVWFVTPGGDSKELKRSRTFERKKPQKQKQKPKLKRKKGRMANFLSAFPNPFRIAKASGSGAPVRLTKLSQLNESKTKLRAKLTRCKSAQREVNFEVAIAALSPAILKPISSNIMSSLVQNTITLVNACENKFVLLGSGGGGDSMPEAAVQPTPPSPEPEAEPHGEDKGRTERLFRKSGSLRKRPSTRKAKPSAKEEFAKKVQLVKPLREMEAGDAGLLESMLMHIRIPVEEFVAAIKHAASLVSISVAYCYDVPTLPSGARPPSGIRLEELDVRIDAFKTAIERFDHDSAEALEDAAGSVGEELDMMPRMETFLVSSFLLGLRQAAMHVSMMLQHARTLVEKRQRRHDRSRIWLPHYTTLKQWLSTGGESDGRVLPWGARQDARRGELPRGDQNANPDDLGADDDGDGGDGYNDQDLTLVEDEENALHRVGTFRGTIGLRKTRREQRKQSKLAWEEKRKTLVRLDGHSRWMRLRGLAADAVEWVQSSDDLMYAFKLAVAVFLVSWPGLLVSWSAWYAAVRGSWAPLQLVLVFEVAIGTSMFVFLIRLFGVAWGCLCGFLAYEIGGGNRVVMVAVLLIGSIPAVYVQLVTSYNKAGMVAIVSMNVVAIAALDFDGPAWDPFYKRFVAFVIGGTVALVVELTLYPVRARDRLAESLSSCIGRVVDMQAVMAVGIDAPLGKLDLKSPVLHRRFHSARDKAQAALAAADTFLPFCLNEPRLKGSFAPLAPIYKEIVYVAHQIIDRMDCMMQLRKEYGSSVLEDLNPQVHAYRRHVAASICIALFAVNEALTTRLPLPQFLPSSRVAQLRLVSRVRDLLAERSFNGFGHGVTTPRSRRSSCGSGSERAAIDEVAKAVGGTAGLVARHRFLSWNAAAAGHLEIIEYLEELVELAKLLVGVNAFRSGMLERPNYMQYVRQQLSTRGPSNLARSDEATASGAQVSAEGGALRPTKTLSGAQQQQEEKKGVEMKRSRLGSLGVEGGLAGELMEKLDDMRRRGSRAGITEVPDTTSAGSETDTTTTTTAATPLRAGPATEQHVESPPRTAADEEAVETDSDDTDSDDTDSDDEADALPISLQRVGTRLREEHLAERRRRASTVVGAARLRGLHS